MSEIEVTKEMVKQVKREYFKNYRENNKSKIKAINKRYWERRALKSLRG